MDIGRKWSRKGHGSRKGHDQISLSSRLAVTRRNRLRKARETIQGRLRNSTGAAGRVRPAAPVRCLANPQGRTAVSLRRYAGCAARDLPWQENTVPRPQRNLVEALARVTVTRLVVVALNGTLSRPWPLRLRRTRVCGIGWGWRCTRTTTAGALPAPGPSTLTRSRQPFPTRSAPGSARTSTEARCLTWYVAHPVERVALERDAVLAMPEAG